MMLREIGEYLESEGFGEIDEDIFLAIEPEEPDNCIILNQYGGDSPLRIDKNISRPGLQVVVRDKGNLTALERIDKIGEVLNFKQIHTNESFYPEIRAKQSPFSYKKDENGRFYWVQNYEINRRNK